MILQTGQKGLPMADVNPKKMDDVNPKTAEINPKIIVNNLYGMARSANQPAESHEAMATQAQALVEWIDSTTAELEKLRGAAAATVKDLDE